MSRDLKADLKHISENPSITKLMELTEEAIERALKAEAELPALREENDIQRASIQELSRQLVEAQADNATLNKTLDGLYESILDAEQDWSGESDYINYSKQTLEIKVAEETLNMPHPGAALLKLVEGLRAVVEAAKEAFKEIDIRTHTHSLDMGGNPGITMRVKQGDKKYWQAVWAYNEALSELDKEGER